MNWTTILANEARRDSILRLDDIARRYNTRELVVRSALSRYENHGLVEHVSNKVYINKLNQHFSPRELVNVLRPDSYISLESVLAERGISSQSPNAITCVTLGYPRTFKSSSATIVYRRISKKLYWGFEKRSTRYNEYQIARPEKALLDWIYLNRQEGLPTPLDEINLQFLDMQRLKEDAERYPKTVKDIVSQFILDHALAA